ncbi:hypothetical protein M405DRAFT_939204 [Rhizopogon salebrosus TDB-379]|nr:hypothetical protein M405DRAFT_939204 [Rhizopogon salebrosus TDB-379]
MHPPHPPILPFPLHNGTCFGDSRSSKGRRYARELGNTEIFRYTEPDVTIQNRSPGSGFAFALRRGPSIKDIGYRIDHILATFKFGAPVAAAVGEPGGRYDNDFVDFREISILPTADEILPQQPPFLRPSGVLEDPDEEARAQSWPSESCSIHPQVRGLYRCRASDDAGGPCGETPCLGQTKVGDGIRGLYARISIRRLGRCRGREGFGNARALQNMFSRVAQIQAERLEKERKQSWVTGIGP